MAWLILVGAGLLEAVWALALAGSNGLRRLWPSVLFVAASLGSLGGLALAMRDIPTGTAYAVWTGIGAAATVGWGVLTGQERATVAKMLLLGGLLGCVLGLKLVH